MVSNRQPYAHHFREGKIACQRTVSGVVTALQPVVTACSGLWVAHGDGSADRHTCDPRGIVHLPPEQPQYRLKRVWLSKEEVSGYYYGFSNEALWPLCHIAFIRPSFRAEDWQHYQAVNRKFAEAVLSEVNDRKAFVWIQDYHFALLPAYLKAARPDLVVAQFWHIPWPNPEIFRICHSREEILGGLLSNDLLGFHLRYHADNFLATCDREIDSRTDQDRTTVTRKNHRTRVQPFPISVDFEAISRDAAAPEVASLEDSFRAEFSLNFEHVLIGLDRIDYTKGILERLQAVSRFIEKHPEYRERFVFVQVGSLSRMHIRRYKDLNDEINDLVEQINWRHSTASWTPITFVRRTLNYWESLALYQLGNICIVSSLHDGMNLVAKEYVAAKNDLNGVLILSRFTGAARELTDAVLINPYNCEAFADQIKVALDMDADERQRRMARMREQVAENNIYRWASRFVLELSKM
ncbi:MAG: trehalose-6-phosphate synthase [Acidobacteria bacterium]|nr:trehalose-6-phosphate synthase [Acidobacteriota bacterium]